MRINWDLFVGVFFVVSLPFPILAQGVTCPVKTESAGFQIKDEWKTKFPFDMVYPVGMPVTDITTKCPVLEFFGEQKEMCSIMQIARLCKSAFMAKIVIDMIRQG